MSIAQLRNMLDEYPDHAYIDVQSEKLYGYGGWSNQDREFFVFKWSEK